MNKPDLRHYLFPIAFLLLLSACSTGSGENEPTATPEVELLDPANVPVPFRAGARRLNAQAVGGLDMDCQDFPTWELAQGFYLLAGGTDKDPFNLDADRDGIACEALR